MKNPLTAVVTTTSLFLSSSTPVTAAMSTGIRMVRPFPPTSPKIAVIGAGAAGLAATRAFLRNGISDVTVLEQDTEPGGVWNYRPSNPKRGPMYRGLRTNLPRELMAFREKPWGGDGGETPSYVTHGDVRGYLREYAEDFELQKFIRYGASVTSLAVREGGDAEERPVSLRWTTGENGGIGGDTFDAVCVCNGHYSTASTPKIPGLDSHFRGSVMHSVEYDDPSLFEGKTVLCVGGRASGADVCREISKFADRVYLSDSTEEQVRENGNVVVLPRTEWVDEEGGVHFKSLQEKEEGFILRDVDVIILCSGYDYDFSFIKQHDSNFDLTAKPGERRVSLLYEQLWHARHPNISFIGLQHSVVPFPFFEFQAEAVARELLHKSPNPLPSLTERLEKAKRDAQSGGPDSTRVQDTHHLGKHQWEYCRTVAKLAGVYCEDTENYIATNELIYNHAGQERKKMFPGGEDKYRSTCYVRNDDDCSFQTFSLKEQHCISSV